MNYGIELIKKEDLPKIEEFIWTIRDDEIREEEISLVSPRYGDIWVCILPILVLEKDTISFQTQKRPILVIDDTQEHFIKNDHKNYYGLKITSQEDSYQRVLIKNYYQLGLRKKSYLRLELPIKIEREQFLYKISRIEEKSMKKYTKLITDFIKKQT